jgi:hypothetical protein
MNYLDFLEAISDQNSILKHLDFVEFRCWSLLLGAIEVQQPESPLFAMRKAEFERFVQRHRLILPDESDPHSMFILKDREVPLGQTKTSDLEPENPDQVREITIRLAALRRTVFPVIVDPEAARRAQAQRDANHSNVPPGSELLFGIEPRHQSPANAEPAQPDPCPEPSNAEDRENLASLEAAYAAVLERSNRILQLPNPPHPMVEGVLKDIENQITCYEMQRLQMAGRTDLQAFPAKLVVILGELTALADHCRDLLSGKPAADKPAVPSAQERAATLAAESLQTIEQTRSAVVRGGIAAITEYLGAPDVAAPKVESAPNVDAIPSKATLDAIQKSMSENNERLAQIMKQQREDFEARQKEHQIMVKGYDEANKAFEDAFFGRRS